MGTSEPGRTNPNLGRIRRIQRLINLAHPVLVPRGEQLSHAQEVSVRTEVLQHFAQFSLGFLSVLDGMAVVECAPTSAQALANTWACDMMVSMLISSAMSLHLRFERHDGEVFDAGVQGQPRKPLDGLGFVEDRFFVHLFLGADEAD